MRFLKGILLSAVCLGLGLLPGVALAQSLKTVFVPEPTDLTRYVVNRAAAIQLGKALFWDMQVGSDGIVACASCHFSAGADSRTRNQVNPGTEFGDRSFYRGSANLTIRRGDFPHFKLNNPDFPDQGLARPDNNDVTSSQGVKKKMFVDIRPGSALDRGTTIPDPVYNYHGKYVRQVTNVNSPTVINAVFNFTSFLDGRANNVFNGVNPWGAVDTTPKILVNSSSGLTPTLIRIRNASLASQATGPPLSDVEMSWRGRTWPKIGKKMLSLSPLAKQVVHPQDSVLGPISNSTLTVRARGLRVSYADLIKQAFAAKFWNNASQMVTFDENGVPTVSPMPAEPLTTSQYTQMEANFSLFFGLAVQLYEMTLIADNSKFDLVMDGQAVFTQEEQIGFNLFDANCSVCHAGPEMTLASVSNYLKDPINPLAIPNPRKNPPNAIEFMAMLNGRAFYDIGFYNISVRPTGQDIHRGENTPFPNPLTPGENYPKAFARLALLKKANLLPPEVAAYTPNLPLGFLATDTTPTAGRTDVFGAFKTPNLRNVELTGPYHHDGGAITLREIVDFYTRGGDFVTENIDNHAPAVQVIGSLRGSPTRKNALVSFLLTLTDERVRVESAPFDHPELFVVNGALVSGTEIIVRVPEVGNRGRFDEGLPPLGAVLDVNHFDPN